MEATRGALARVWRREGDLSYKSPDYYYLNINSFSKLKVSKTSKASDKRGMGRRQGEALLLPTNILLLIFPPSARLFLPPAFRHIATPLVGFLLSTVNPDSHKELKQEQETPSTTPLRSGYPDTMQPGPTDPAPEVLPRCPCGRSTISCPKRTCSQRSSSPRSRAGGGDPNVLVPPPQKQQINWAEKSSSSPPKQ